MNGEPLVNGELRHPLPFEALFDHAPFGYLITNDDDVIERANQTFLELAGFDGAALLGRRFRDLLPPGFQLLYETRHLPVLRLQGYVHEVFLNIIAADGTPLPVLVNAVIEGTEVRIGVLAAANRVSYEQELLTTRRNAESLAARVAVLQSASTAFAAGSTETAIAQALAVILEETLVASDTCVAVIDDDGALEVVAGTNALDGLIRGDEELLGANVLQFEKPVVVNASDGDVSAYPWVVGALLEARLQTVAVFPIMSEARPIGVVAAFFRRERALAENEVDVVLALARQASSALSRLRAQQQLAFAALHDQLTDLANRASIRHGITLALQSARRFARPLSVMFLDLDGFKSVNDARGHHVGDAILREVASRLRDTVRGGDVVGRYGGDEFVVICGNTDAGAAEMVAARIRDAIRVPFVAAEGFAISASVGIAVYDGRTIMATDTIISVADAAMYESKRLGRDRSTRVDV